MEKLKEYMRSILGAPNDHLRPDDLPSNIHEDFRREFGRDDYIRQPPYHWSPEMEYHILLDEGSSDDLMRQGDPEMLRQLGELFESFFPTSPDMFHGPGIGSEQFPPLDDITPSNPDHPPLPVNPNKSGSLRDRMLKQPDSNRQQDDFGHNNQDQFPPFPEPHSWFGGFWESPHDHQPRQHPQERVDKDLDGEIESGKHSLDDILLNKENIKGDDRVTPRQPRTYSSQSYSRTTRRDPHGNIESRTTRRDSSGREEVIITRKLGDQEHTITHRKNKDGSEETEENTVNLDQDKLTEFNERWKESKQVIDPHMMSQEGSPMSSIYKNIVDQFFGRR